MKVNQYNKKYTYEENLRNVYNPANGKYYSRAQLDSWATDITKIKTNKGKSAERKAHRKLTQGKRYNNRQAQRRQSYNEHNPNNCFR